MIASGEFVFARTYANAHTQTLRNFRSVIVFPSSNLITIGGFVTKRHVVVNVRRCRGLPYRVRKYTTPTLHTHINIRAR